MRNEIMPGYDRIMPKSPRFCPSVSNEPSEEHRAGKADYERTFPPLKPQGFKRERTVLCVLEIILPPNISRTTPTISEREPAVGGEGNVLRESALLGVRLASVLLSSVS